MVGWNTQGSNAHLERNFLTGAIVSDRFLKEFSKVYRPEYFSAEFSRVIAKWCLEHHKKYNKSPKKGIQDIFEIARRNGMDQETVQLVAQLLSSLSAEYEATETDFDVDLQLDTLRVYFHERALSLLQEDLAYALEGGNLGIAQQAIEKYRATPLPETLSPLEWQDITPTSEMLQILPRPREYLFQNLLPKGIVGAIIAIGGTGKGFLMNALGLSLATGDSIGPFRPARAFKVLYLGVEDDQDELHRRAALTAFNIWPQGAPQRVDNFIPTSMAGKIGPLMQLDKKGTPVNAPAYNWLCETLEALGDIEVLILDPKSMLYGLEENNNDHNTAWVKCLQSIAQKFGITIIFCHHESKARAGSQDAASSRGGAALTDGCRWVANIRGMSEKVAEKFALTDHQDYVEFVVTKSNYAPRLPNPVYFRRGKHGELSFIDLVAERLQAIARMLVEMLAGLPEPLTMNQLIYRPEGRDGRDKLKEQVESFGRKDLGDAVGFALEAKWLGTLTRKEPGRGNPKSLLVVLGSNRE